MVPVLLAVLAVSLPLALTSRGQAPFEASTPAVLHLPAAAHVAGAAGTDWRTDVELHNPAEQGTTTVTIDTLLHGQANTAPPSLTYDVVASESLRLDDILDSEFGLDGTATLRLTATAEVVASARTFNTTPDGTYGQFIAAVDDDDEIGPGEHGRLAGLHAQPSKKAGSRTNIGLVNATGASTEVRVKLNGADGNSLGTVVEELAPYEYLQINRVFERVTGAAVRNGWAAVWSPDPGSGLFAYASVVDNLTGDPIYIPAEIRSGTPNIEQVGIQGTLTENGDPAVEVSLSLLADDGASTAEIATTATDAVGHYLFTNVPPLPSGTRYFVMFGPNESDPGRLYSWYGPYIDSFSGDRLVSGGDFDVADVPLLAPVSGSVVGVPVTFSWQPRGLPGDEYTWFLFDQDSREYWLGDVVDTGSYTLDRLPSGVTDNRDYLWWILVWSGPDSYGESFGLRAVRFEGGVKNADLPAGPWENGRRSRRVGSTAPKDGEDDELVVPGCAHVGGAAGTNWRTDLVVHNPEDVDQTAIIDMQAEGSRSVAKTLATLFVPAGSSVDVPDVLWSMFNATGSAVLRVVPAASGDLLVSSRTYNLTENGTYGQFVRGRRAGGATDAGHEARLVQLTHKRDPGTGFRTNLGIVNVSTVAIDVVTELYTAGGSLLGAFTESLPARGYRQINRVFERVSGGDVDDGYAVLQTDSPEGAFHAYASVVDNRTGDPVYIPAVVRERPASAPTPTPTPGSGSPRLTWLEDSGGCAVSGSATFYIAICETSVRNDGGSGQVQITAWKENYPDGAITETFPVERGGLYTFIVTGRTSELLFDPSYDTDVLVSSPQADRQFSFRFFSYERRLDALSGMGLNPDD